MGGQAASIEQPYIERQISCPLWNDFHYAWLGKVASYARRAAMQYMGPATGADAHTTSRHLGFYGWGLDLLCVDCNWVVLNFH